MSRVEKGHRKALVCGASKGIGRAVAVELARQGVAVVAWARSEPELRSLQAEFAIDYSVVDFSDPGSVEKALRDGPNDIDILICNSGGPAAGPLIEATTSAFESAFQQHLFVNHRLMQKMLPHMKAQKFGRIVTILSTSVKAPLPNLGVSNTLRAAVAAWAKTLATELGPFGVTVNNVLPGYTATERLQALKKTTANRRGASIDAIEDEWLRSIPAGRFADASEIASAVSFLASPEAAYINGINLPVDGGRLTCL
jgi:3-oxoacyl-[acyl-carrier protein] reductase